ncbi:MAG: hypothetical protein Alis3KO_38720 [Aliiglaciecola sp.]
MLTGVAYPGLGLFNSHIEEMGIKGIIISAACVAIGMILSLPTKMFLTFILVKREADHNEYDKLSRKS